MHDDVNDEGRNLEYAAGGVIWPTPLLLYIISPPTFSILPRKTYITGNPEILRRTSIQSKKFVFNSLASARSLPTKEYLSQTYYQTQLQS